MYPSFTIFGITIYSFGLALSFSFLAFFGLLYHLSLKIGIHTNFFFGNVLAFFLGSFVFSRLFYIVAEWRDFKYLFLEGKGVLEFFFMSDYNFALMGGVFGFFLVLLIQIRRFRLSGNKFIDTVVLAFLLASVIGFIGAFLGGQIYGRPTTLPIGITYHHSAINPYTTPVFPLALMYAAAAAILGAGLYVLRLFVRIDGFVGYVGMALFATVLLGGEVFR